MKQSFLFYITGVFLLYSYVLGAQQSEGGIPWSFTMKEVSRSVQEVSLATPEEGAVMEIQHASSEGFRPEAFALLVPVNRGPGNSGTLEYLEDDRKIWRLQLTLNGSNATSLYFNRFALPGNTRLYIYSVDQDRLLGAFTKKNNRKNGLFATALIQSGSVILELNVPAETELGDWFNIAEMTFTFPQEDGGEQMRGFGTSDFCEVNINCSPEGDNWQDEKRGVVRIQVKVAGAAFWCTGSLVNNTRYDNTPYVLTADHCAYKFGQYASEEDLENWIFYFNYEAPECDNPLQEPELFVINGCEKIAQGGNRGATGSDFYLVRLMDEIPTDWNVYFNGWSTLDVPSFQGVTIHHPDGDLKKVSTYTETLETISWQGNGLPSHWLVYWSETLNNWGVTEGGSSGAPMFDAAGHLIGTLTGGLASCSNTSAPDYYGKFSYHWTSNGTADTAQLRPWLDPDNTGIQVLNGSTMGIHRPDSVAQKTLEIYPNPVSDHLFIRFPETFATPVSILVVDIMGRRLDHTVLDQNTAGSIRLDVSDYPVGIYFVIGSVNRTQSIGKFSKY